jgi:hypothetical protein
MKNEEWTMKNGGTCFHNSLQGREFSNYPLSIIHYPFFILHSSFFIFLVSWHNFFIYNLNTLMAKNIIEAVQEKLGYAPLQKIDPNVQDTSNSQSSSQRLAQAAIPAVLTAIYRMTRTEDGTKALLQNQNGSDALTLIYQGKEAEAAENISRYSGIAQNEVLHQMKNIAEESMAILKDATGKDISAEKLKNYMNTQRHNILVYLPATLDMGDMLHDETLDDRTNKMEGPVSNFMHKIEDTMSGGGEK